MKRFLQVAFGRYTLAFECADKNIIELLALHFHDYLTDSQPDLVISITTVEPYQITSASTSPQRRLSYCNEKFNFGPNLIEGQWDIRQKSLHMLVSKALLVPEELWLFDRFLCTIFYRLVMQEQRQNEKTVIIHGAGIIKDGKGYLFFGPSGSGKSCIAQHSKKLIVMHDDMNIITVREKTAFIEGVPFNPKLIDRTRSSAPLTMICSLHKAETVDLIPGPSEAFIEKVLPEIFLPLPLLSVDRKHAFDYLLTSMKAVSAMVPYYRLYFRKDETFWDRIIAMETSNGCHEQPVCPAQ